MKILSPENVRKLDAYTIENEPILDINLMERAAKACANKIQTKISTTQKIYVFCGTGNNGGDGLAIARMLADEDFKVEVFLISEKLNANSKINFERLKAQKKVKIQAFSVETISFIFENNSVIVDAIFGSGLNKPASGIALKTIKTINNAKQFVISIDIPSGFFAEDNSLLTFDKNLGFYPQAVCANWTLTLELPFLSFFFPDSEQNIGNWEIVPIGLDADFLNKIDCNNYFVTAQFAEKLLKNRKRFTHKGTYGHALLVSGCYGKMGAAILASRACLRSGVGLLTTHIPRFGYQIMQTSLPEAMLSIDTSDILVSEIPDLSKFSAVGIGPALGTKPNSRKAVASLFEKCHLPLVIDADALNIISESSDLLNSIPINSILTPHPLEFERLAGKSENYFARYQKQLEFAKQHQVFVVLKGANTCICTPKGESYFNSTGNSGMATAGSGDVLTGIILALLAQAYEPKIAAILGVFLHGKAGDLALSEQSYESLIASDITENLGKAFHFLATKNKKNEKLTRN